MISNIPLLNFKKIKYFFINSKNMKIQLLEKKNYIYGFLSRSYWSLALIIYFKIKKESQGNTITLLLPKYFCESALIILRIFKKVNIIYYNIDEDLLTDVQEIKSILINNKIDIFLFVNYFGLKNNLQEIINECKKNEVWVIEDATHNLKLNKNNLNRADFIIYSPYKFLSIPNGAILVFNKNGPNNINLSKIHYMNDSLNWYKICIKISREFNFKYYSNISLILKWLFKRMINSIGFKLKLNSENIDLSINRKQKIFSPKITFFSQNNIYEDFYNIDKIIYRRTLSFNYIFFFLKKIFLYENLNCIIYNNLDSFMSHNPYMIIVRGDSDNLIKLSKILLNMQLPHIRWPDLPLDTYKKNDNVFNIKSNYLYIPFNHTYKFNDIKKIHNKYYKDKKIINDVNLNDIFFNKIDKIKFDHYYNKLPKSNLLQSINYTESKKSFFLNKSDQFEIIYKKDVVGIIKILKLNFLFFTLFRINRSPLLFNSNDVICEKIFLKILNFGNFKKFNFLLFSPEIPLKNIISIFFSSKNLYKLEFDLNLQLFLDLRIDLKSINSNFDQKWRNMLNKSKKENIHVSINYDEFSLRQLITTYNKFKKINNFSGISTSLLLNYKKKCNKYNDVIVLDAMYNDEIISSICLIIHGLSATYVIGVNNDTGRKLNSNYLLLWESIKILKKMNINYFDLGGADYENYGILNFKKGTNAEILHSPGSFFKF